MNFVSPGTNKHMIYFMRRPPIEEEPVQLMRFSGCLMYTHMQKERVYHFTLTNVHRVNDQLSIH